MTSPVITEGQEMFIIDVVTLIVKKDASSIALRKSYEALGRVVDVLIRVKEREELRGGSDAH